MIGLGIALGMLASDLYVQGQVKITPYWTILTRGVNIRGRIRGRLYAIDVWREYGNR